MVEAIETANQASQLVLKVATVPRGMGQAARQVPKSAVIVPDLRSFSAPALLPPGCPNGVVEPKNGAALPDAQGLKGRV
jgi:hypothetical protein